ncbi:PadR family transcriptional regulator [Actinocorallia lasiicapitis]
MTLQTQMVLDALLRNPAREMYGRELAQETGLTPGTTHLILLRLEAEDWVTSYKEDIDPSAEKRPARRYYRLTATGTTQGSATLATARRPSARALRGLAGEGGAA